MINSPCKIKAYSYYVKRCEDLNLALDLWDFEAHIDSTLTYTEMISFMEEEYFSKLKITVEAESKELKAEEARQEQRERELQQRRNNAAAEVSPLLELFKKPSIIGVLGNVNTGKSMLLYHIIHELQQQRSFSLYTFGLRCPLPNSTAINSIEELEQINNSVIVLDEFFSLFDLDNRKYKTDIENSLRLINHKNNILILAGVGENFKKFISNKLDVVIFKNIAISDLINGSRAKSIITNYKGLEAGSSVIALNSDEAIIFDGKHYQKIIIPYYKENDTKLNNNSIFVTKSVSENREKM